MTYWSGMSTRSREIHILLNELSRVNHLQCPTAFDRTEGFITWVQGKGWDFNQEKYDAVVKYWHRKTDEGASTDQTRATFLIKLLLEHEDDVLYDNIFELILSNEHYENFSSKMRRYWEMEDEKTWNNLTTKQKKSECRSKWNNSDGVSKYQKLIRLLSRDSWGVNIAMFNAMISLPKIVDHMYQKWVIEQPELPAYEMQVPGQTRRR